MTVQGSLSERAVILAPSGRDAAVAALILKQGGFGHTIRSDIAGVCEDIADGAGLAIIADEALRNVDLHPIASFLRNQPAWSDLPIVLLTQHGGGLERNPAAIRIAGILGNVTFLERPFHPTTLTSIVSTALRGRRRQYEARTRLDELREGEQRLQTALRAGRLGSWTLDIADMTLHASESCRSHFGRGSDQKFTYTDLMTGVNAEDLLRIQTAIKHSLRTGEDYVIEFRNMWPNNTEHWVDFRARVVRNDAGDVAHLVGVSSDITERKTYELERERLVAELDAERSALSILTATLETRVQERTEELLTEVAARERAQEQLLQAQKMESIGQLTGGVAHDFNNLLMAVMANMDLLRKHLANDPRAVKLIDSALQGATRGASLTQRMLAFARQQRLETRAVDLTALLVGMRDLLNRTLGPQIILDFKIPTNLPAVKVDPNQVELAILNLAINARDAMPGGGSIQFAATEEAGDPEKGLKTGFYLCLEISDSGTGMDEATLKRAVEPFFSTKPLGKGTGLGLSMVHGLAEQLGGLLELRSIVGVGTTATLWLPTATNEPDLEMQSPVTPPAEGRKATILVVDDDPLVAMGTIGMLEDLGHVVLEANSGKQALEILEGDSAVDLMMTDQAMPGMSGIELAQLARKRRPAMPVLLATGYADLSAAEASDLPLLSKPYRQAQLQAEIERLLQRIG